MYIPRLVLVLAALLVAGPAFATTVLPMSLQKMSQTAEIIFYGRVTASEARFDDSSGRVATFTTFQVLDVIKGNVTDPYTMKQPGGRLPDSNVVHRFHGVPRFSTGNEYVVFLPAQSRLGFASPVGLSQGRFSIIDINGSKAVSNGRAVNQLLPEQQARNAKVSALKAVQGRPAATELNAFVQTVRELAR